MLVEIGAVVDRQRAVVDRRAVGDDHRDAALLGAVDDGAVRPPKRLAVDILLEKPLATPQPPRPATGEKGSVGSLVHVGAVVGVVAGGTRAGGGRAGPGEPEG